MQRDTKHKPESIEKIKNSKKEFWNEIKELKAKKKE